MDDRPLDRTRLCFNTGSQVWRPPRMAQGPVPAIRIHVIWDRPSTLPFPWPVLRRQSIHAIRQSMTSTSETISCNSRRMAGCCHRLLRLMTRREVHSRSRCRYSFRAAAEQQDQQLGLELQRQRRQDRPHLRRLLLQGVKDDHPCTRTGPAAVAEMDLADLICGPVTTI